MFPRTADTSLRDHGPQPDRQRDPLDPSAPSRQLRVLLAGHPPHDLRGQRAPLRDGAEWTLHHWGFHHGHQYFRPRPSVDWSDGAGGGFGFDAHHTGNEASECSESSQQFIQASDKPMRRT